MTIVGFLNNAVLRNSAMDVREAKYLNAVARTKYKVTLKSAKRKRKRKEQLLPSEKLLLFSDRWFIQLALFILYCYLLINRKIEFKL